ncbi:MAG: tyrosine-type recombinase/integrase [Candidatus Marinimicrobia bacterium]|jgi:site-specific recombinase XerD|nr:tyrosine-type recombinase/integrase [Candidatus Neomarinimicrobiota bacterium]MBT4360035.1 tyrosine-type recombinase/integrase [Candidatus Neomarinimicrobiota bacterium]MBT4480105.1 tyrosine-type recombinase/integrase [Candidatus Neomarinimicrobiota bacterium]MBT4945032.1 tyrosine-type recombinase/integrase [Candidatus Neomarinimicrobiota bacterium]MBT5268210.1 tyrosine-type recombinase/integrase [Candidatus Neomarinimicrobiota bacterium]
MASINKVITGSGARWVVDYYDINHKRRQKTFRDRRTAKEFKLSIEHKKSRISAGLEDALQPNLRFDDMKDEYLSIIDGQKKAKTIEREKTVFRALRLFVPNEKIRNISASTIRQYVHYRVDDCKVSPSTVNTELRALKTFFNTLIAHNYVQVNPIMSVKMLPVEKTEPQTFTDDEIEKILKEVDDPNYLDLVEMYLHTGARRSELLLPNFTWDNVDFEARMIRLRGKFDKERFVPLDNKAFDILHKRRFQQVLEYPFNFDYDYMYKKIKKYITDADVPNGTLHGFRRSFASKLVQSGIDIYVVSKLLGHSSVKVTEQAYIHLLDSNLQDSVRILDEVW